MGEKAETGVMQPQAKECQEPPEAGIAEEGLSLEPSEGERTCLPTP